MPRLKWRRPLRLQLMISYSGPDMDKVASIYQELKFKTLLEKIAPQAAEEPQEAIDVQFVTEITEADLADEMAIHIEMMDENYLTADILGLA